MDDNATDYKRWLTQVNKYIAGCRLKESDEELNLILNIEEDCNLTEGQKKYLLNKFHNAIYRRSYELYHGLRYVWSLDRFARIFRSYQDTTQYILGIKNSKEKVRLMKRLYKTLKHDKGIVTIRGAAITHGGKYRIAMDLFNDMKGYSGFPDEKEMYSFLDEALK